MYPKHEDDPLLNLVEAMAHPNDHIERQEKRGQDLLIQSNVLPREFGHDSSRHDLEEFGVEFGLNADDLFVFVSLPKGWRKEPTDHSMWSNLLDDKGRIRANIFYKAAFYDRRAFIDTTTRFTYTWNYDEEVAEVLDGGKSIWRSEKINMPRNTTEEMRAYYKKSDILRDEARTWLDKHYPDWRNKLAYWD